MAGIDVGSELILITLKAMLVEHLQDYVDSTREAAIEFDPEIEELTLDTPDDVKGYRTELTVTPQDRGNSIVMWVDRTEMQRAAIVYNAAIEDTVVVGIRWNLSSDLASMGRRKRLCGHALKRTICEHWHKYLDNQAGIFGVRVDLDFREDSTRATSQTPGRGGRHAATGDSIDSLIARVYCIQKIANIIQQ